MSYPQETFAQTNLHVGTLLHQRREAVTTNTLLYQLDVLKKTGRYDAFKLKWHPSYDDKPDVWPIPNHLFWDSDVAKWIEGACYLQRDEPHPKISMAIEELVDMIREAQQSDGYLNIHFTVVEPNKRFTNLRDMHELYNAGHMIEAALAHHDLYRNDRLLEPICKYVRLLCHTFGADEKQKHGYPGHPEIELALIRLYNRVKDPEVLKLANYFLSERGNSTGANGRHYYVVEAEARGETSNARPVYWQGVDSLWYYQAHVPIIAQPTIEGHSVRAMYLLTAAADIARIDPSKDNLQYLPALKRLWRNMVDKKMYLTGGIGAIKQWEGFGRDYFLPQSTDEGGCYAETCAAIGVMMLAERLLQTELDGEYGDIMELCLYNAVLTAMSHDGTAFTYENQLASSDSDLSSRQEWFTCACCPPNMLRLLGQIGGYATTFRPGDKQSIVNVHLFTSLTTKNVDKDRTVTLEQKSDWPWSGTSEFTLQADGNKIEMNIRIPGWSSGFDITPTCPTAKLNQGYLHLPAEWLEQNPSFTIRIPITPRLISPHPYTNQDVIAIARGPVVYCVEDVDNPWVEDHFKNVQLSPDSKIEEQHVQDKTTSDSYVALTVRRGASILSVHDLDSRPFCDTNTLQQLRSEASVIDELHFVPYFFRANRGGRGQMRVGLKKWYR